MRNDRLAVEFGYFLAGTAPIATATLLIPLREELAGPTLALAFVVVVVSIASFGGRGPATVAAVVSVMSFDFFLTRPYLSMRIDSADDIEAAVLLLVVGLIVGTVAARERRALVAAEDLRGEVRRIAHLADMVASGVAASDVISAAQHELTGLLDLEAARFESAPYDFVDMPLLERSGVVSGQRSHRFVRGTFALPASGVELRVLASGRPIGRFVLLPKPDVGASLEQRVVAVALADQVGAALAEGTLRRG